MPARAPVQAVRHPLFLVVDDEDDVRNSLKEMIVEGIPNASVEVAASAAEALQILNHKRADAVLADYYMPGKNGVELLREVHRRDRTTRLVLMTAHPGLGMRVEAAQDFQIDDFVPKSHDTAFMLEKFRRVLEKPRVP